MDLVNRLYLGSPSIPSHTRPVAKRTNCLEDNCPGVHHVSPVRMPKLLFLFGSFVTKKAGSEPTTCRSYVDHEGGDPVSDPLVLRVPLIVVVLVGLQSNNY